MVGWPWLLRTAAPGGCVQQRGLLGEPAETKHGYLLFCSAVREVPNVVTVSAVISLFLLASCARKKLKVMCL